MSADSLEISNLLYHDKMNEAESSYTESELQYLSDNNNKSYNGGMISFDLSPLRDRWVVMRDMFVQIPINIVSSDPTRPFLNNKLLSFKQSVLDLIYGIQLTTNTGQTVISDTNINLINNLRLYLEKDQDWSTVEAPDLMFSPDTSARDAAGMGIPDPTVNTDNEGFMRRTAYFKQGMTNTVGVWSTVITIPLRYLHPWFEAMDFPIVNTRFQLNLLLNAYQNQQLSPFGYQVIDPNNLPPTPILTVGPATVAGGNLELNCARLYYKSVKFDPSVNSKLISALSRGITKKIYYRSSDLYIGEKAQTGGRSISTLISASTVRPLRVFLLASHVNELTGNGTATFVGEFNNANIMLNNTNYYQNSINTPNEWYSILQEQFPSHGSSTTRGGLLSFVDFLAGHRIHCFDVSRQKSDGKNPNASVSIQIQATRTDNKNCDYYYIVERLSMCTIEMSSGEMKIVVGLEN